MPSHQHPSQTTQAALFNDANAEGIEDTRSAAIALAGVLLTQYGKGCLGPLDFEAARQCLADRDLRGLFAILRTNAVCLSAVCGGYWDWIDAVGSVFDATGTRWPYLTAEGRARHLSWAQEGLLRLRARFLPA